jgi:hypothetical protein
VIRVLVGVVLARLFCVVLGLQVMALRHMGVMRGFVVFSGFVMFRGGAMMSGCLLVVICCLMMVFSALFRHGRPFYLDLKRNDRLLH